ncbi:MAG: WD40/YVTN/BNR-like repeat-containing protein [Cyclobacteriaceae bacterium]
MLEVQNSATDALLIGLHAIDENVVWASGTNSTIIKTNDGGMNWKSIEYPNADTLQFRDIHGLSKNQAVVLSIGEGEASSIFHFSVDSGWTGVYQMPFENGFLDAFDFWENGTGIAYGDAVDSLPFILITKDFGLTWYRQTQNLPLAGEGEGGFASSGTLVETGAEGKGWIGTGAGGNARILFTEDYGNSWLAYETPMVKGKAAGITSVRFEGTVGFITGGDISKKEEWSKNVFWSDTQGKSWYPLPQPKSPGAMYGSGFAKVSDQYVTVICGPEGADLAIGIGAEWKKISPDNLWTATLLPSGIGWLAGNKGKVLRLKLDQ